MIITVLIPMRRISANRSTMPPFNDVLEFDHPERATLAISDDSARRRAALGDLVHGGTGLGARLGPHAPDIGLDGVGGRPVQDFQRPLRYTPLIRVWAEKGVKVAPRSWRLRSRRPCLLASTTMLRPSGVSSAE